MFHQTFSHPPIQTLFSWSYFAAGPDDEQVAVQAEEADAGIPPTFTEKPKIVPNDTGTLVTMIFRVLIIFTNIIQV